MGYLSAATLANALRRRRTVSVCAGLKRAKRGRFAYFALGMDGELHPMQWIQNNIFG
jgi:hypothetical protein